MTTKARRATRALILKCLARTLGYARLNAGDAQSRGRTTEAAAWLEIARFLTQIIEWSRAHGLPVQRSFDELADEEES